jgi:hypothetical protein
MTLEQDAADKHRAALALLAAAADDDRQAVTAILGRGWHADRCALIAWQLAYWLDSAMRSHGWDAAQAAREVIAESIAAEATGGTP